MRSLDVRRWGAAVKAAAAKLALAAAAILLSLAVIEAALRLFSFVPDDVVRMGYEPDRPFRPLAGLPYGHRPGRYSQVFFRCRGDDCRSDKEVDFSINSAGLRDVEHVRRKPPGTFRILVLGDSFSVGYGVSADETYPKRLEALLDARFRGRPRFEVINAGVDGYSTRDELAYLENYGLAYRPDCVVVGLYLNDVLPSLGEPKGAEFEDFGRRNSRYEPRKWTANIVATRRYRSRLYLGRWWTAFSDARRSRSTTIAWYRFIWSSENRLGQSRFISALAGLARVQKARRLPVLVLVFPRLDWLDEDYPFEDIHARLGRLCRRRGLASADLLGFLRGRKPASLWAHPSDHHPNAWTHRLAAAVILEKLAAEPRFGLPPPSR